MLKSRGILIAGNWKMNHGPKETEQFFLDLEKEVSSTAHSDLSSFFKKKTLRAWIFPPDLSLVKADSLKSKLPFPLTIGAQNAHWEKKGAFTGEISGPLLQEIGIQTVLIGHSERRHYFGETNETVRLRTESLLNQGFQVIMCIGETQAEREAGQTREILTRQIKEAIPNSKAGISHFLNGKLILAYEPVWAIGTGLTATPDQVEEAHQEIRNLLRERNGEDAAQLTPILYGGSVTPENADSLLSCENVDGALIGGASLKASSYFALLQSGVKVLSKNNEN